MDEKTKRDANLPNSSLESSQTNNDHVFFWVRFDHVSFKLYNVFLITNFWGKFRNFSFWATSHFAVMEIQRTPEGPEFRMPESRQHREEGGKIKWLGRSQILSEVNSVFCQMIWNFRNLGVFFFTFCFLFSNCLFFCWGDVNNFGGDVYLNCLRDWFTSHYTDPGSLTVTCYMTAFSMENVRWWIIINLPTFLSYFCTKKTVSSRKVRHTPNTKPFYERNPFIAG